MHNKKTFFVCIVVIFLTEIGIVAAETENEEFILSLDVARENWIEKVSFCGNYTFKHIGFYSEQEARVGNIEDKYIIARGFICKSPSKYRLQVLYTEEPDIVKKGVVENRSSDVITNKNFWIAFNPAQGHDFAASGSLNKALTNRISDTIRSLESIRTPFTLFLDSVNKMPVNTSQEKKYKVTQLKDGVEMLSFTGKNTSGYKYVREIQ